MARYSHISVAAMGKLEVPSTVDAGTAILDGIPMKTQLYDLCTKLRAKFPKVKFHCNASYNNVNRQDLLVTDVLVYVDDCDYVLGRIGHGYYGMNSNSNNDVPEFMVESRKIMNEKYGEYRDQYHRVFTRDIDKALKNALRYLLPYSPAELVVAAFPTFKEALDSKRYVANRDFEREIDPIRGYHALASELENLVNKGVEFSTVHFQLHAKEIVTKFQRMKELTQKQTRSYFITIRTVGNMQMADVATCKDPKGKNPMHDDFFEDTFKVMNVDDLPDDIKAKVAALMLVDTHQYIEGVGQRATERSFWVER